MARRLMPVRRISSREEDSIQRAVCQHLRQRGAPGLLWFHVPNGGRRRPIEAAIMKGLGVQAGVSDLILLCRGRFYALELKSDTGRPTEAQMEFVSRWNDTVQGNGAATIAHGLDAALRTLEIWGLLRGAATLSGHCPVSMVSQ